VNGQVKVKVIFVPSDFVFFSVPMASIIPVNTFWGIWDLRLSLQNSKIH
jgi:hypothetical protein